MELSEAIRERRSVRRFKPDPVPRDVLEGILDLAIWAPSGMNRQEWYFVVVQGEKTEEMKTIFADAFQDLKPRLEMVFADKPKVIAATKEFFETVTADHYVISADGEKHPHPSLETLIWIVETAKEQGRSAKIHVTNETESTGKLEKEYDPDEYRYQLITMNPGDHVFSASFSEIE